MSKHNTGGRRPHTKHMPPMVAGANGRAQRLSNGKLAVFPHGKPGSVQAVADLLAGNLARAHAGEDGAATPPPIISLDEEHAHQLRNLIVLINEAQVEEQKQRMIRSTLQYAISKQVMERYGVDIMAQDNPYLLDLEQGVIRHRDAAFPPAADAAADAPTDSTTDGDSDAAANGDEETIEPPPDPPADQ